MASAVAAAPSSRSKNKVAKTNIPESMRKTGYLFCYLMLIPAYYGIVKYIVTNFYSISLGFFVGDPFTSEFTLVHFQSFFEELFSGASSSICIGLRNTMIYFAIGIFKSILCFVIAYFLYKKVPLFKAHRFLLFLPCIIPSVASVAIFKEIICKGGPIYTILNTCFGVDYPQPWASSSNEGTAMAAMLLYCFLGSGIGNVYLIYMGNMRRIPDEILESARLDGVGQGREFKDFILPLTWGTFSTFLLMSIAGIFCSSGPVLYFFNDSETIFSLNMQTLGYILFDKVRGNAGITYYNSAAAIGLIFTAVTIPIVIITRYIAKKIDTNVTF